MRKMGSALLGVALVAAAIGMWSKSLFVTDAAALSTGPVAALEQTAAAVIADRFPTNREMFRNVIGPQDGMLVAPSVKGDKQSAALYPCGDNVVFAAHECFASQVKPKPVVAAPPRDMTVAVGPPRDTTVAAAPPRATTVAAAPPRDMTVAVAPPRDATIERRPSPNTSELVRTPVAATIAPVVAPASCKQNLPAATARMERILTNLKGTRARPDAETCSSYRSNFFEMVQVREVTALCKSGRERDLELVRIDGAVDNINGAIAQSCESI